MDSPAPTRDDSNAFIVIALGATVGASYPLGAVASDARDDVARAHAVPAHARARNARRESRRSSGRGSVSASAFLDAAAPRARFIRRARVGTTRATFARRRAALDGASAIARRSADAAGAD